MEQAAAEITAGQMALSDGSSTRRRAQERQSGEAECFKARLVTGGAALLQRAHILEKQDRQRCGHCEEAKCMRQSLPPHHALQESPQRLPPATSVSSRATDLSPRGTGANSMLPLVETQGDRVGRLGRSHLDRMTCR